MPSLTTATVLALIERWMNKMLQRDVEPYEAGLKIWALAGRKTPQSPETLEPLWLIWGALTDWVELRPAEKPAAEREMLRAANEWIALLDGYLVAQDRYLDRWVYNELGYERKKP